MVLCFRFLTTNVLAFAKAKVYTAPRHFVSPVPMEVVREVTKRLGGVYLPTGVSLQHQCFHQKHFLILDEQPVFHF